MKRVFVILKEDIKYYPPIQSLLQIIQDLGYDTYHLGTFSDDEGKNKMKDRGIKFVDMPKYPGGSLIKKFIDQLNFKRSVKKYLNSVKPDNEDVIWIAQSETIILLHDLVGKYNTILHPLEFRYVISKPNWKYRLLVPNLKMSNVFKKANEIVCCEYNRAQITQGVFGLKKMPTVLPNKMFGLNETLNTLDKEKLSILNEYKKVLKDKKIILYQGVFNRGERRLDEFCEAISLLPEDMVLLLMGPSNDVYEELKNKYQSDRIFFIPFIKPPFHLEITKLAHIGILSYFPGRSKPENVLNPLYCAPNKIFEYAKFGIPMIGNDIPGLKYIFNEYHCGLVIKTPFDCEKIANSIQDIEINYNEYSEGARNYYNSVDLKEIVREVFNRC